jgi:hypothetical protein
MRVMMMMRRSNCCQIIDSRQGKARLLYLKLPQQSHSLHIGENLLASHLHPALVHIQSLQLLPKSNVIPEAM